MHTCTHTITDTYMHASVHACVLYIYVCIYTQKTHTHEREREIAERERERKKETRGEERREAFGATSLFETWELKAHPMHGNALVDLRRLFCLFAVR